jgi:AraC-like DNA-binding protein
MTFYFNAYSTPLLFGFVHGWLYAILLWVRGYREERLSDALLGGVLVGCCFNIWEYMLGFGGVEILWRQLDFFPRSLGFLFPPLCYFYLKSQFDATFRFSSGDMIHLLPFAADTAYHLLVFFQGPAYVENWKKTVHDPYHIADITFVASTLVSSYYIYGALTLYRSYREWTQTQFSDTETISFRWFRNFILAMTASLIVGLTVTFLDLWLDLTYWQDWWDKLFGVVLIYYVSISGYAQPQPGRGLRFRAVEDKRASSAIDPSGVADGPTPRSTAPVPAELPDLQAKLLAFMETEKPYLEPDLSLTGLARRLHTNSSVLSQVINVGTNKNFNDFVNQYRIDAFNCQVLDPANAHLSRLGIALNCGFNSKATFNRAFKKRVGVSPTQYAGRGKATATTPVTTPHWP